MKQQNILSSAIAKLSEITGIDVQIVDSGAISDKNLDAVLALQKGNQKCILGAEIKAELRTAALDNIILKQQQTRGKSILVARYIPTPMKDELRRQHICYLEISGNCYIETPSIFVLINDQKTAEPTYNQNGKLWTSAGIKFLFAVILDPSLLNTSYRNIASISGVALGNVGNFISEMKRESYIITGIRNNKPLLLLDNKVALINKWSDMYKTVLRPKQLVGKFRFSKREDRANWLKYHATHQDIYWGGETAGAILTGHFVPQVYTIYSNTDRFELIKKLRLVPDASGEIEILRPFWNGGVIADASITVPPVLAYAELISSLDSRNREIAARIMEKYVG